MFLTSPSGKCWFSWKAETWKTESKPFYFGYFFPFCWSSCFFFSGIDRPENNTGTLISHSDSQRLSFCFDCKLLNMKFYISITFSLSLINRENYYCRYRNDWDMWILWSFFNCIDRSKGTYLPDSHPIYINVSSLDVPDFRPCAHLRNACKITICINTYKNDIIV